MDLNQNDLTELRMAAEKRMARPNESPHARRLIAIDADKLLWLLDACEDVGPLRGAQKRQESEEKECCCVRVPPYDGCPVHE